MKAIKFLSILATTAVLFSCSDDDDADTPELINDEETITTMNITLTPQGGGDVVEFTYVDLDGDGPNAPEVSAPDLAGGITYVGSIELLNESEEDPEDITEEIMEEDEEHQLIFETTGSLNSVVVTDVDGNNNPVGLAFTLETLTAGAASLTVYLKHEPIKPNDGTFEGSGGESEFEATFPFNITQ
ncbi:type 1 periplasmic binding fold superfamily protein [Flavobacterium sp. ASW18X]|uniref:type 1 periplasmic binding fold superfamily protein n=1 Tax=Flavobacterium sp. ASW18X TaxID=2572595 RepID=UPI0010AED5A0|nr:type 1 periplasmic binding fold superfamily protein [Flavobacterium sp. ASW18X]TKD66157.1 type 1 periplasmic binding fold superfamily protein [Flavobacterium sp. ASW18X]